MHPQVRRILANRPFQVGATVLALYALLGFLLLPALLERALPDYVRDTLHRQASIGTVRVNPFLLTLTVENLKLSETDGKAIAAFRRLFVDFETSSLFHWAWTFKDVRLEGLDMHIERSPQGALNLATLLDSLPKDTQAPPQKNTLPPRLLLWHLALIDGRLSYLDRAARQPANVILTPIDLDLKDLTTLPERHGALTLHAKLAGGGTLEGRAKLALHPFTSSGRLALKDFPATTAWPFLRDHLRLAEVKGVIDLAGSFSAITDAKATRLSLSGIHLHVTGLDIREPDASTPLLALATLNAPGVRIDLDKHHVTLPQLALSDGQFGLAIARDGKVNWARLSTAELEPTLPPPTAWQVSLDKVQLANIAVQVVDRSRAVPLTLAVGRLGASLKLGIAIDKTTAVTAAVDSIDLAKVDMRFAGDTSPALALSAVDMSAGRLDTGARTVTIGQMSLRDGQMRLIRSPEGRLRLLDNLRAAEPASTSPVAATSPWRYRLAKLTVQNFKATLADAAYEPALTTHLDAITATLKNIANDSSSELQFDAALHVVEGGNVSAIGTVSSDHDNVQARLIIDKVNLVPLQPLIARHTRLTLDTGVASAAVELEYTRQGEAAGILNASGTAGIDDVLLKETLSGERFLACNSVAATGIHFRSAPGELIIDDVRVIEPDARVLIFPDRSINLIKAFETRDADMQAPQAATAPPAAEHFPIKVTRVRIERGKVDYNDKSLVLPFSTRISDFHGTVTGIASDPDSRAKVRLDGTIEQYGTASVRGTLSPFAPKHYTDIRTRFTNVEMPKFSPYSATFAGREIATGKLTLNLEYKIEDGKLTGDNMVLMDHFTLGTSVQSKDALDLPLDMAVALLTDAQGHIDIAIPVTGDLTKPNFALGKVIGEAVKQVLVKIITAPFRALGALLGGGKEQQFDAVTFSPGSSQLAPPQLEKLKQLGDALAKRPQLKLLVEGRYDPSKDGRALRAAHVRRTVSKELKIAVEEDQHAAPVVFDEAKSQRALEVVYAARAGDQAVAAFQETYEAKAGKSVERVNPVLAVFGKPSPDSAFYAALYKELVSKQPLADSELPALGRQRADVITQALIKEAGVAPERITAAVPKAVEKSAKTGVATTLSLSVVAK